MSGIPARYGIEVVNGIIIGETRKTVALFDPDGNQQAVAHLLLDESPEQWAIVHIENKKTELGPEYFRLGWDRPWEVRVYD